ncbi:uncharacterized protein LOC114194765 isoform X1 [Vigna unguiculata]|uniref:uncharacterized protein LOC114194765 isoform X1 n=1 Tax=Vigna unguiculata TaxID=3917 RepID=UPI001016B462|nr:uncharacterized protein LOC114194765 isoform X1 [Vigna unguiculata]
MAFDFIFIFVSVAFNFFFVFLISSIWISISISSHCFNHSCPGNCGSCPWRKMFSLSISLFSLKSGFEKPSAIQQRGIVPFCKVLDVIQQAQSGIGKTATFCFGVLQQLDYNIVQCQVNML